MINAPEVPKGTENFWEYNPEYTELFDKLYKGDRSKNKNKSSQIMWAFYHMYHPKSIYHNLRDKEQKIKVKFLKNEKFDFNKYSNEMHLFKENVLTQPERSLMELNETLRKRDVFLSTQTYTIENARDLDTILANTAKLYQIYDKIKKDLKEEQVKKGRKKLKPDSASDAGRI